MIILKVISSLLQYPSQEVVDNTALLAEEIKQCQDISAELRDELQTFLYHITSGTLMDRQEEYGYLFDSGRSLSLLLFEHVHGESRDRGQAMVDLMSLYEKNGLTISVRELPDYIPLFLEYLAMRPEEEALEWLADVSHILAMLSARLQERESPYHLLFDALLEIANVEIDAGEFLEKAAAEERDDTAEAFDKVWEEEAVRFGAGSAMEGEACQPQTRPQPFAPNLINKAAQQSATALHWVDNAKNQASNRP